VRHVVIKEGEDTNPFLPAKSNAYENNIKIENDEKIDIFHLVSRKLWYFKVYKTNLF